MNKHRLWLLLTILIAFALRLTLLGEQSLWYDEGITWLLAQMSLPELIHWTAADIQPPLYYLFLWFTSRILGDSEWALRFPAALFNTLTLPLIYILAHRLFSHKHSGKYSGIPTLAVLLLALSPLMIYYSQEARMYTLLVFEATLASYLLLKILHPSSLSNANRSHGLLRRTQVVRTAYSLIATATLYTHYFAAFLLIVHALSLVLTLWRRHWPKALINQALQIFGLTALLFAPWIPTLLSRLSDDPSYWPGTLKLNEALRKVLISFTAGETVFEQTGWWLALGYLAILIIGSIWAIANIQINKSTNRQKANKFQTSSSSFILHPSSFLFLWLFIPPLLILALSYQSPKFNPRYTMLSYPAFVLLLTVALSQLLTSPCVSRFTFHVSRLLFTLCLLFIFSAGIFSLHNWFTISDFEKDDFQALAQFVREREASDETVLLSSGHMFPVWAYYYGWQNWTPLPQMDRLDVNRVTDLSIANDIAQAVDNKGGVWLVSWQDEVIDPNGIVPFWLDLIGQRPLDAGDFQGVGLEHWRLIPDKTNSLRESPIKQTPSGDSPAANAGYNFANQVNLLGMTQLNDTEIVLFWQPHQPLSDDLTLTLDLTDKAGFDWDQKTTVGRPGAYVYPPSRWPVGQMVMTRHHLPWLPGTPPGSYIIEVGLGQVEPANDHSSTGFTGWNILDKQGRPQRRTALLGPVNLNQLMPSENISPPGQPVVDFLPVVTIQHSAVSAPTAEPGDRILLALVWQAGESNQADISIAFDLIDAAKRTFSVGSFPTPSRDFNLSDWQPGDTVLGQYWLDIPSDAVPGPAILQIRLINTTGHDKAFPLDELEILPTERNFIPPETVNMPIKANFSGQTTLLGVDCSTWTGTTCRASPGESVTLTLYWQVDAPFDKNYTIFTHLLDPNEIVMVNADHTPAKNTQGWIPGEIIADTVILNIPADLAPGNYAIEVGLYDAADSSYPRLSLNTGETRVILSQSLIVK